MYYQTNSHFHHYKHPQSYPYHTGYRTYRPDYPDVNTEQFQVSASAFQALMEDAHKIVHAFSESKEFANKVMSAAQQSQTEKIQGYFKDIGIERLVKVSYNPDSIRLTLVNQANDIDCCKLSMAFHW